MPPKRNTTAKRGRAGAQGRSKSAKEHVRVLSDITEESTSQLPATKASGEIEINQRITRSSKKRPFQEFADDGDGTDSTQAAKRNKQVYDSTPVQQSQSQGQDQTVYQATGQVEPVVDILPSRSPQIPSLNLLFFVQLATLDTDDDTERITLSLINLTLIDVNWHPGLSGMVQTVACFLVASLLTRKQNLVEEIASSINIFGLGFEELVEGYALLWEWRANMRDAVGVYAVRLDDLPEPRLLLSQDGYDQIEAGDDEQGADMNERPEPERRNEAIEV